MCSMSVNVFRKQWKRWQYQLRNLEGAAKVGCGMLALSVVLAVSVLIPTQQKLQQTERELAEQRRTVEQNPQSLQVRSPDAVLAEFYRFLPPEDKLLEQVAQVLEVTEDNGIEADRIEYAVLPDAGGKLRRYQMTMPVRGTYPNTRYFMIDLLNQMPSVAISDLSFRRQDPHGDQVESRMRLTFYLRRGA
jgi:hypothetical protein